MEPVTTAWMMATLLSGWVGNRGDFWLCQGFNKLNKRISENIDEPSNHHIQRAVRKSYLNATFLAVEHIQKQRNRFSLTDRRWDNLNAIKNYIKEGISSVEKEDRYIRNSPIDNEYRDVLFPKEGITAQERMPELIKKLKDSIINELESKGQLVESELRTYIYEGWKEGSKEMNFYKLTCAFFTQELKDNTQISTFIQTEYLDHIAMDVGEVSLKVDDLKEAIQSYYRLYKDVLSKVDEILSTVTKIDDTLGNLENIPEKTVQLLMQAINDGIIAPRNITIAEEYQTKLKTLEHINNKMTSLRSGIEGLQKAMNQVDENTKVILKQNISNFESQLLIKRNEKEEQENKLNEFANGVINLAKQLEASKNLNSERLKKARALFAKGKYEELNDVLNENDMDKDAQRYAEQEKTHKEQGEILINEFSIKAQATLLNMPEDWFIKTDRLYLKAISIIENYNTTFNYAIFLGSHRQIDRAIKFYKKALFYCVNDEEKTIILNNLGLLQKSKNDFENAEKSFQEALEIKRKLAEINPHTYLSKIVITLNNLGDLQRIKNENENAEKSFQEALEITRKLTEVNPKTDLLYLSDTLINLGILQNGKNEFENAEKSYQEALEIRRKLAEVNPHAYLPEVAISLNNLGVLQKSKNDFENAEKSYQEALEIRRELVEVNPQIYLPKIAISLNNLGDLQRIRNDFENAEKSLKEALEIRRKLAEVNPHTYLSKIANTLNSLGVLQNEKNEYENAERSLKEALDIRRKLAEENPQTYLLYLSDTLNNLGLLQYNKNEYENAEKSYQETLEIRRRFAETNPQTYLPKIASILNNLGDLQKSKNEYENAEKSYQEALEIREKLAKTNPQVYLISYGDTCVNVAILYKFKKRNKQKSILYAKNALEAYASFVPNIPHAVQWSKKAEDILVYWEKN